VSAEDTRTAPSELVSGFLAVLSLAASVLAVFWDPIRVSPFAIILALISAAMAPRDSRLPLIAVVVGAVAFVVGATLAVTTNNPLY
jgi:hypothetical protein